MTIPFQNGAVVNCQSVGNRPENVEIPFISLRAPNTFDILYPTGKRWIYVANAEYVLLSLSSAGGVTTANWVQVVSSTGNILSILGTASEITATTSAGVTTLSIPAAFIAPGSITATLGAITATNGNLVLGTLGNKLVIPAGTNGSVGVTAAMTSGAVTTVTTAVTANSIILYSVVTPGGTVGTYTLTKSAGTSFTITSSSGSETSTFNYEIIN